jgi:hypothetical protein
MELRARKIAPYQFVILSERRSRESKNLISEATKFSISKKGRQKPWPQPNKQLATTSRPTAASARQSP